MQEKQLKITRGYHFLAEGIIIYLALLPINYSHYQHVSVWAYFAILLAAGLLYTIGSGKKTSYVLYLSISPILFYLFYMIGYPLLLSIIFAGLFVWRFIVNQSKGILAYETTYLSATFLLTLIGLLFMRDFEVMIMFIAQIIVLLFGFTIGNVLVTEKDYQRTFHKTEWIKWSGIFLGITTFVYLLSDALTWITSKVWFAIGSGLSSIAAGLAIVFQWIGLDKFFQQGIGNMEEDIETPSYAEGEEVREFFFDPSEGDYFNLLVIIIIGVVLLILVYAIYKSMKTKVNESENEAPINFTIHEEKAESSNQLFQTLFKRKRPKPNHPVRRIVFDFERKTAKLMLGRFQHESIENWFNRIGIDGDIQIYQKFRYGEENTTVEEEEILRSMIKSFEASLHINKKEK